jgi:hypothetical protein
MYDSLGIVFPEDVIEFVAVSNVTNLQWTHFTNSA